MMRMKSLWVVLCFAALTTGLAFGQGATFYLKYYRGATIVNPNPPPDSLTAGSADWTPLLYDCSLPQSEDNPVLQDGVVVRIMRDRTPPNITIAQWNHRLDSIYSGSPGCFYSGYDPADVGYTIGGNYANFEIMPTNEFPFNSEDIPAYTGGFLSPQFDFVGGVPSAPPRAGVVANDQGQRLYLAIGCWVDTTVSVPLPAPHDSTYQIFHCMYNSKNYVPIGGGYNEYLLNQYICALHSNPDSADYCEPPVPPDPPDAYDDPFWKCWGGSCPPPEACDVPPAVQAFAASENNCANVVLTWSLYDTTGLSVGGFIDSLIIKRLPTTTVAVVPLTQTSYNAFPPDEGVNYTYTIQARRTCGITVVLSDPASDTGMRPNFPSGVNGPTILTASQNLCGLVRCTFNNPTTISYTDSVALLRDGVIVAKVARGNTGETNRIIEHLNAPAGQAQYSIGLWNATCGLGTISDALPGEALQLPGTPTGVDATDGFCSHSSYCRITWNAVAGATSYRIYRTGVLAGTSTTNLFFHDTGGAAGTPYAYTVSAVNSCGEGTQSDSNNGFKPVLIVTPSNLQASDSTQCDRITITWTDNSNNEDGFVITRTLPLPEQIFNVAANTISYDDMTASLATTYTYKVKAMMDDSCFSEYSSTNTGRRKSVPRSVTLLAAGTSTCDYARITWNQSAVNTEDGFKIFRDTFEIDTAAINATFYNDTDAIPGVAHSYLVKAYNACGDTTSPTAVLATRSAPPGIPGSFVATNGLCDSVVCTWTTATGTVLNYWIYRQNVAVVDSFSVSSAVLRYKDTTALPNITYTYWVKSANSCGKSDQSLNDDGDLLPVPGQVTGLVDSAYCNAVALSWYPAPFADIYKIYFGSGSLFDEVTGTTSTAGIDGPRDFYVVASNACGDGVPSDTISVMPLTVPEAPTDFWYGAANCDNVTLHWSETAFGQDGFIIWRNSAFYDSLGPLETSYVDTDVVAGSHYAYALIAYNECGVDGAGEIGQDVLDVPPQVTGVEATDNLCGMVTVTWTDPDSNETGFKVYRAEGANPAEAIVILNDPDAITWDDETAVANVEYTYTVVAFNECGEGLASDPDEGLSLESVGPPPDVTATTERCDQITVEWGPSTGDVDQYKVFMDGFLAVTINDISSRGAGIVTTPGEHEFIVVAYSNECADSAVSETVTGIQLAVPEPVVNLTASNNRCDYVELTWEAPASGDVTGYVVLRDAVTLDSVLAADPLLYSDTTAVEGINNYSVITYSENLNCDDSDPATAEGTLNPLPTVPTNFVASDTSCTAVYLTWSPSTGTFDEYVIYQDAVEIDRVLSTDTSYVYLDATPGDTASYQVSALDDICGETALSNADDGSRGAGATPPANVAATDSGCVTIEVTWDASTGDFTEYRIYRDGEQVGTQPDVDNRAYLDTLSAPGVLSYTVTAYGATCGESLPSEADQGELLPTMTAPQNITASFDNCLAILLNWDSVDGAVSYNVFRQDTLIGTATTNSYNDSIPVYGDMRIYQVGAVNHCGMGTLSTTAQGMRPAWPPAVTTLIASNSLCGQVCMQWEDVEGETVYHIYREGIEIDSVGADVISYCDDTITPGTEYTYTVSAGNVCGVGYLSNEAEGLGFESLPEIPITSIVGTCNDVCLQWTDIENEIGYKVYREGVELDSLDANTTSYCDTTIIPGTCEGYVVRALNTCGAGLADEPVQGCRLSVPAQPTLTHVSDDVCFAVCLTWDDLGNETGYTIYRDSDSLTSVAANVVAYCDSSGNLGVGYNYVVAGFNACGEGERSAPMAGHSNYEPDMVDGLIASADQCSTIVISWNESARADSYLLYEEQEVILVLLATLPQDSLSYTHEDITGPHSYVVYAVNQCDTSEVSETVEGFARTVPGQALNLTPSVLCGTVTLNWSATPFAVNYVILRKLEDETEFARIDTVVGIPATDVPPHEGTWIYEIIAANDCGEGLPSESASVTIVPALDQVTGLTATTGNCNCVSLTWIGVDNETGYEIYCGGILIDTAAADAGGYEHCSPDAIDCDYTVRAVNDCGAGPLSDPAYGSTIVAPGQVTGVSATDNGCNDITITWTPVDGAVTYTVFRNAENPAIAQGPPYTDFPAPGTYNYTVYATNECGNGPMSDPPESGTRLDVPSAPVGVTVTERCDQICLSWTAATGLSGYHLYRDGTLLTTLAGDAVTTCDNTVEPDVTYQYCLNAVNECGESESVCIDVTAIASPGFPELPDASDDRCNEVFIHWGPASGDVDSYRVYCEGEIVGTVAGTVLEFTREPLGADTCEYMIVAVSDECGEGEHVAVDEGISHIIPATPATLDSATSVCDSIQIYWSRVEGEVAVYQIYRDDPNEPIDSVPGDTDPLLYWDLGVDDMFEHNYWVKASNICGTSASIGPVVGLQFPLFEIGSGLPFTVRCLLDTVTVNVRFCENIDSVEIWMSLDGGPFDAHVATFTELTNTMSFTLPDVDHVLIGAQLMARSTRGDRVDSTYSDGFEYDCIDAADELENLIPTEFYIAQNYPNPFNPETTIEFGVPRQAMVTIEIFDVLGRKVATPVSSYLEPGVHSIKWSCDACGTGMYIVRMVSENKVFNRKMLMMK